MTKETLAALEGSIRKWEAIVRGEGDDYGRENCPLCQLYTLCAGCPIHEDTKISECRKTPYKNWERHQYQSYGDQLPFVVLCPRCEELAQAELDYLKGLLP